MDEIIPPKTNGSSKVFPILAIIILLIIAGMFLVKGVNNTPVKVIKNSPTAHPTAAMEVSPTTGTVTAAASSEAATASVATVQVSGGNFYFKPNEIHVKKGQKVIVTFTNDGGMHDFVIDEFNVKTDVISGGKTAIVSFTPDKTGIFQFYCSIGRHRQMGMQGNLIVE